MIYACVLSTPLGPALARAGTDTLTGFWFVGQKYYPALTEHWEDKPDHPVFVSLRSWLEAYFDGHNPSLGLALNPPGTPFRKMVWELLLQIPYGCLSTYGDIARQLGEKRKSPFASARAIGGAVGHNPISVLIPCHRVIGATGGLTGYAGGIDKKQSLLRLEKANPPPPCGNTA